MIERRRPATPHRQPHQQPQPQQPQPRHRCFFRLPCHRLPLLPHSRSFHAFALRRSGDAAGDIAGQRPAHLHVRLRVQTSWLPDGYGIGCAAHDAGVPVLANCAGLERSTSNLSSWCLRQWCYVGPRSCDLSTEAHPLGVRATLPSYIRVPDARFVIHFVDVHCPRAPRSRSRLTHISWLHCAAWPMRVLRTGSHISWAPRVAVAHAVGEAYTNFSRSYSACASLPPWFVGNQLDEVLVRTRGAVLRAMRLNSTHGWSGRYVHALALATHKWTHTAVVPFAYSRCAAT